MLLKCWRKKSQSLWSRGTGARAKWGCTQAETGSRMNRPPEAARNAAAALCTTFPGLCKAKESLDLAAFTPAHLWARRKGEERKDDLKGGEDTKHLPNPLADGDTCSSRNETRRHSTHAVCRSISVDIPSGSNSS